MSATASQITGVPILYSTVCSSTDKRKDQSSASLAFVMGIHRWPVNSRHKWPVTRKIIPFDDGIMNFSCLTGLIQWQIFCMVNWLALVDNKNTLYNDVIMGAMASQITGVWSVCSTIWSKKNIKALRHWPWWGKSAESHKGPVTRKIFPFDDIIMQCRTISRGHMKLGQ